MHRMIVLVLAAAALAGLLLGCGKPQTESTGTTGAPPATKGAPSAKAETPAKSTGAATTIQSKGSDTLLQVAQALAEAYKKAHAEVDVNVTGGGSGTGFKAMLDGTTDIANSSRKVKDEETKACGEKGIELTENLIGYDGIAVIVNKDNPVEKLTVEQLADLYTAKSKDWSALGGKGEVVLFSRETTSGTYEYFKEHVLNKGDSKGKVEFDPSASLLPSTDQVRSQVAATAGGIGYIGLGYIDDSVKVVPIVDKDGKPVTPTQETVKDGTYPISRPLFMYVKKDAAKPILDYLEWIKGADGQAIVTKEGFVSFK